MIGRAGDSGLWVGRFVFFLVALVLESAARKLVYESLRAVDGVSGFASDTGFGVALRPGLAFADLPLAAMTR